MEIAENGYMFSNTYSLEEKDIYNIIKTEIEKLDLQQEDKKYKLEINVVKNKDKKKLGYSYIWIDNNKIFNALIGKNFDGSKRIERIEEESSSDSFIQLELNGKAWADIALEEEEKISYVKLKPLVEFPEIELKQEDKLRFSISRDFIKFNVEAAYIFKNNELKNSLYALKVPKWLKNNKIKQYFEQYEKDKTVHHKNKTIFTYPIVQIKNSTANITFSPLNPNLSYFVQNMAKKIKFENDEKTKSCLLFFYQSKKYFK